LHKIVLSCAPESSAISSPYRAPASVRMLERGSRGVLNFIMRFVAISHRAQNQPAIQSPWVPRRRQLVDQLRFRPQSQLRGRRYARYSFHTTLLPIAHSCQAGESAKAAQPEDPEKPKRTKTRPAARVEIEEPTLDDVGTMSLISACL
jgi:hypothetical protein